MRGHRTSQFLMVTIATAAWTLLPSSFGYEETCSLQRRLLEHQNEAANSVLYDGDWGKPPCECTVEGQNRWTGVETTMSLVTAYSNFVDVSHPIHEEFKTVLAEMAGTRPRAVKIHRVDPLDIGLRVSVSIRMETCGPSCKLDAEALAAVLDSSRLSNESTFFNSHHPILCSCSQLIWEGMSIKNAMPGCRPCSLCDMGKYQDILNADYCKLCPKGTYSGLQGNSHVANCTACVPGKWADTEGNSAESACKLCVAGKYSTVLGSVTSETCSDCAVGKYLASEGNDAESDCTSCPAGTSSTEIGANRSTVCRKCAVGSSCLFSHAL